MILLRKARRRYRAPSLTKNRVDLIPIVRLGDATIIRMAVGIRKGAVVN